MLFRSVVVSDACARGPPRTTCLQKESESLGALPHFLPVPVHHLLRLFVLLPLDQETLEVGVQISVVLRSRILHVVLGIVDARLGQLASSVSRKGAGGGESFVGGFDHPAAPLRRGLLALLGEFCKKRSVRFEPGRREDARDLEARNCSNLLLFAGEKTRRRSVRTVSFPESSRSSSSLDRIALAFPFPFPLFATTFLRVLDLARLAIERLPSISSSSTIKPSLSLSSSSDDRRSPRFFFCDESEDLILLLGEEREEEAKARFRFADLEVEGRRSEEHTSELQSQ